MPRAKKQPWRCKQMDADTRRRCVDKAGDDGWCDKHRALHPKPTGRKPGPQPTAPRKYNLYSKHWREENADTYLDDIIAMRGQLHAELDDTRHRLARIVTMIAQREAGEDHYENREQRTEREATIGANGQAVPTGTVKQVTVRGQMSLSDLLDKRDTYVARIVYLEQKIKELAGSGLSDPREAALAIRQALREMDDVNDVPGTAHSA